MHTLGAGQKERESRNFLCDLSGSQHLLRGFLKLCLQEYQYQSCKNQISSDCIALILFFSFLQFYSVSPKFQALLYPQDHRLVPPYQGGTEGVCLTVTLNNTKWFWWSWVHKWGWTRVCLGPRSAILGVFIVETSKFFFLPWKLKFWKYTTFIIGEEIKIKNLFLGRLRCTSKVRGLWRMN